MNHNIVYTFACIESDRIEHYNSAKKPNDHCSSHTWNEHDDDFEYKLDKLGRGKNIFRWTRTCYTRVMSLY